MAVPGNGWPRLYLVSVHSRFCVTLYKRENSLDDFRNTHLTQKEQKTNLSKPQVGHLYLDASFEHTSQVGIVSTNIRSGCVDRVISPVRYSDN